jgi:hypothetical protein
MNDLIGAPYRVTTQSVNLNVFRSLMNNGTYLTQSAERVALFASNLATYNCNIATDSASNMSNFLNMSVWVSNAVTSNQQALTNLSTKVTSITGNVSALQIRASNWDFASNLAIAAAATSLSLLNRSSNWDYASNSMNEISNVAYAACNAAMYGSALAFAVSQREPDWDFASNMIDTLQSYITSLSAMVAYTSNSLSNYAPIVR